MKSSVLTLMTVALALSFSACGSGSSAKVIVPPPLNSNEWTWIGGANVINQPGTYGTLGTAAPSNVPGGRWSPASWTDMSGNFWLFGGLGPVTPQADQFLNDLWKYSAGEWTWMGGSNVANQIGSYGTLGVAAPSNIPGARAQSVSWTDGSGNFWLLGGIGLASDGESHLLNDLWKYSAGEWTWMGGSNLGDQPGTYGTQGTAAPDNVPGARSFATSWIDVSGDFWLFGGSGFDSAGNQDYLNDLWKYSAGEWTWVSGSNLVDELGTYGVQGTAAPGNVPGARIEAVSWIDASGNLWLFGGSPGPDGHFELFNDLWTYGAGEWTWVSGANTIDQTGTYGSQGTASADNVPGARVAAATWVDASGGLWLFGGDGYDSVGSLGQMNDVWKDSAGEWIWIGGPNVVGEPGMYGILGTPAAGNIPGARTWAATWTDASGNFWLMGGNGFDSTGTLGYLNDLWKYEP
jgi:N-acetylneuraminic acid mutarotase